MYGSRPNFYQQQQRNYHAQFQRQQQQQRQQQYQRQQQQHQQQQRQQQQRLQMDRQRQQQQHQRQQQQQQQWHRQQQVQLQQRLERERQMQFQQRQQEFHRQSQERLLRQQQQFSYQADSGPPAYSPVQRAPYPVTPQLAPQPVPLPPYSVTAATPTGLLQHQGLYPPLPATADPSLSASHSTASLAGVVLTDGTQIVIQQDNQFLFIGPTGVRMVVNCLPLFDPPSVEDTPPAPTLQDEVIEVSVASGSVTFFLNECQPPPQQSYPSPSTTSPSTTSPSTTPPTTTPPYSTTSPSTTTPPYPTTSPSTTPPSTTTPPYPTTVTPQPPPPPTPLPPSPPTIEPDYVERSGWLTKLSHQRGVFGDKWQKRFFVLNGPWIFYYKKEGDSTPRGCIHLWPLGWCKSAAEGSQRMSDAVADESKSVISMPKCFAVHRPSNFLAPLSNLLSSDNVADVFHSHTVSVSTDQSVSRTFYMTASSDEEKDAWVEAISNNLRAYSHSCEAQKIATKELRSMLGAVNSSLTDNLPSVLLLLYRKRRELLESHRQH